MGWAIQSTIPGKDKRLPPPPQIVHNGCGTPQVSCRTDIDGSSSRRKAEGREFDSSPPSTAEVKNEWSCTSLLPIRRHGVDRDSYTFFTRIENVIISLHFAALTEIRAAEARVACLEMWYRRARAWRTTSSPAPVISVWSKRSAAGVLD
jgi:hypothetical protein